MEVHMEKKKYIFRLEKNLDAYIQKQKLERGIKPINVIRGIIADRKQQDEKEIKGGKYAK